MDNGVQSIDSEIRVVVFKVKFHHLLAVELCMNYVTFGSVGFFVCKIGTVVAGL